VVLSRKNSIFSSGTLIEFGSVPRSVAKVSRICFKFDTEDLQELVAEEVVIYEVVEERSTDELLVWELSLLTAAEKEGEKNGLGMFDSSC
jgi:hypothetical protein